MKKLSAELRARSPEGRIAVGLGGVSGSPFPEAARELFTEEVLAYFDFLAVDLAEAAGSARPQEPAWLRSTADGLAFGRPLAIRFARQPGPEALIELAARYAPAGALVASSPLESGPASDSTLLRLGAALRGDYSHDARPADARSAPGTPVAVHRLVSGQDLGGLVLLPALTAPDNASARGPLTLALDAPIYDSAEVLELATGRSRRFEIPRSTEAPRLSLSTAAGPLVVRLTARVRAPAEAARADVGVTAARGLTAEEILAKHQVWRAARDARWSRFAARNRTSIRFRFADLATTLDLTIAGPFFYEPGKGYDWAWSEAYFNGVKWKGKKVPELPLLQPEKVSELPLELTFNDAYRYVLRGEETVDGVKCWVLDFAPRSEGAAPATPAAPPGTADKGAAHSLYAGTVYIAEADYAVIRTKSRQLNLTGEVQSVDEVSDFTEVPAPDGGAPLRFPTLTRGQWILRTFSRTTVLERETTLENLRLDPPTFEDEKKVAFASPDVMVRDTEKGVRYLERTKDGDRVVVEDAKSSRLFGLGGAFYDSSLDYPLPLLGAYYLDLDFRKKRQQVQVFFGGILLGASFNEPKLLGSTIDFGADFFGIAIRGNDQLYRAGNEDKSQRVKQRSFALNLNIGMPVGRHVKFSATFGTTHRDFATTDDTATGFAIPSNHWVTRAQAQVIWDYEGWAVSARYGFNKRSDWAPWGLPGNPDYAPDKDVFHTYGVSIAKDFHFARFRRLRTSLAYLGSSNTDRFSKYGFGFFGGNSLRGFASGSLRAQEAFVLRTGYGIVVGDAFRIEGLYDHAVIKDTAAGLDFANFGGAGIGGQIAGPWQSVLRFDFGLPVVGRNRGEKGVVISLTMLKIF